MSRGNDTEEPPGNAPGAPSGAAAEERVLDRATLTSIRGLAPAGGTDLVRELCTMYLSDMTIHVASATKAASEGDSKELTRHAHAIKGAAGTFGATRMYVVARKLQEVATSERANTLAAELAVELERVRVVVEGEILSPGSAPLRSD